MTRRCDDAPQAWREVKEGLEREAELRASLALVKTDVADVWFWQGDGHDHPESLTCPVVMSADKLRALVAAVPPNEQTAEIAGLREQSRALLRRLTDALVRTSEQHAELVRLRAELAETVTVTAPEARIFAEAAVEADKRSEMPLEELRDALRILADPGTSLPPETVPSRDDWRVVTALGLLGMRAHTCDACGQDRPPFIGGRCAECRHGASVP